MTACAWASAIKRPPQGGKGPTAGEKVAKGTHIYIGKNSEGFSKRQGGGADRLRLSSLPCGHTCAPPPMENKKIVIGGPFCYFFSMLRHFLQRFSLYGRHFSTYGRAFSLLFLHVESVFVLSVGRFWGLTPLRKLITL